jgi:endo-1,3(4)-beta-glucanase
MNGRNQESSSEAVNAYHGIALYGHYMAQIFAERHMAAKAEVASLVRDTGRMLMSTEVRSAKAYWQVRDPGSPGVARVYPPGYKPHVVGMMWSEMIQTQTWFGSELWKGWYSGYLPILQGLLLIFT